MFPKNSRPSTILGVVMPAVIIVLAITAQESNGFVAKRVPLSTLPSLPTTTCENQYSKRLVICFDASKKAAKGFGKETVVSQKKETPGAVLAGLKSVEGGSSALPVLEQPQQGSFQTVVDESIPVEDRTNNILRDKYGLRTREEQQAEQQRLEQVREQKKKLDEWKKLADQGKDFDIIEVLPAPVLIFVDRFLKAGLAVCTVLFVSAGLAITVEAGSKATKNPLPANVDAFITNVVEPNFTPGLLVLLGFSISLGAFAALQLGSASSTYREDR
jgi:hypothetical protein